MINRILTKMIALILLLSPQTSHGYLIKSPSKPSTKLHATSMESSKSPFARISSVFSDILPENKPQPMSNPTDPESLFNKARTILNSDFGIQDPSLLSNDFIWFGPSLYGKGLKKEDYLAAGNFFDLR